MFAMMALGLGQIFGCFYTGFVVDRFGSKKAAQSNCVMLSLAIASVFLYMQ